MNAILAQVGLASGATQRAHMLLTTKLVIVLALGTAAHIRMSTRLTSDAPPKIFMSTLVALASEG